MNLKQYATSSIAPEKRLTLKKFVAKLGINKAARALGTSQMTIEAMIAGEAVTAGTAERVIGKLEKVANG